MNNINLIRHHFNVSGDYVDLPSKNPVVGVRIEKDEVFLVKDSEGFCEMIPMKIESLSDVLAIYRIFELG